MTSEEHDIRQRVDALSSPPADDLQQQVERLRQENADLRAVIDELLRRLYGKKSERVTKPKAAQNPTVAPAAAAKEPPSSGQELPGHGRTPFRAELPRETTVTDVPKDEQFCSTCKEPLVSLGSDESERGDIGPVRIIIKRFNRKKYGCPKGHEVKTGAPPPKGLVERAKWTTGTYAFLTVSKFGDHLPLDRIESMLKRQGVELAKSTMVDMLGIVARQVKLILGQCKKELLANDHIQVDDTPLTVVVEGGRGTKQGYLWVYRGCPRSAPHEKREEILVMEFDFSRGHAVPKLFLAGWKGKLQGDGYSGFDVLAENGDIERSGCWSHGRRKWKAAFDLGVKDAEPMLNLMRRLWQIDGAVKARALARKFDVDAFEALLLRTRDRRSRRVVAKVRTELDRLLAKPAILPKSPLGKAVTYLNNQWPTLLLFLDDPRIELDTNAIERAIRPVAIGRRNWHVAGSPKGAEVAATLYSIVGMCKAIDVDPYAYLSEVLDRASPYADLALLTPWAWARSRRGPGQPDTS